MNIDYRFDIENTKDRKRREQEQLRRNKRDNRIRAISNELMNHPLKIKRVEKLLNIA